MKCKKTHTSFKGVDLHQPRCKKDEWVIYTIYRCQVTLKWCKLPFTPFLVLIYTIKTFHRMKELKFFNRGVSFRTVTRMPLPRLSLVCVFKLSTLYMSKTKSMR